MKVLNVDLYKEFNVQKKQNEKGELICILKESLVETRKHPAILVIAGGGYTDVSDREQEPIALKFLAENYNVFILNYACGNVKYPTPFIEASMAMCYIKKNADYLSVNKDCVCALGCSAGGHLLGLISNKFEDKVLDFLKEDKVLVRPDASIYLYPVVTSSGRTHGGSFTNLCGENEELKNSLSIEKCVTKNSPPAFIMATRSDGCVPVRNSLVLASAYEENGIPFTLHIFERGNHGGSTGKMEAFSEESFLRNAKTYSTDYTKWVNLAINWLKDRNFKSVE